MFVLLLKSKSYLLSLIFFLFKEVHLTWETAFNLSRKHFYANPFSIMLWYPDGSPKHNQLLHEIAAFFTHILPAYLIDFMLIIGRQKPL